MLMLTTFFRVTLLYIFTFFLFRLMGKRQVAEMQPFDLIVSLMAADLVASPMSTPGASLMDGIIPMISLFALHNLLSFASMKSEWIRLLVSGRPSVLIENGVVNKKELSSQNMNLNDLMETLRIKGTPALEDICFATLETDGQLSVILHDSAEPPTAQDVNLDVTEKGMPLAVVLDGKMNTVNMEKVRLSEKKLLAELKASGFSNEKDVFLAIVNANNDLYIQSNDNQNPRIISRNIGGSQ